MVAGPIPTLPSLKGQGWSVHRTPAWTTLRQAHVSGREARSLGYQFPIWKFELTFDGLDSSDFYRGGLGTFTLQQLMSFYLGRQGQQGSFIYVDPDSGAVTGTAVGTGDGFTTRFQLTRTIGGYSEPISVLRTIANVKVAGVAATGLWTVDVTTNTLIFIAAPASGAAITLDMTFGFICRFSDDIEDFEEIAQKLYQLGSLKFEMVRQLQAGEILPGLMAGPIPTWKTIFITDTGAAAFRVPDDWNPAANTIEGIGGGAGGGSFNVSNVTGNGGDGGAYAIAVNVAIVAKQVIPIQIGKGGVGFAGGGRGANGTATIFGPTLTPYVFAVGGFCQTSSGINLGPPKSAAAADCTPTLNAKDGGDGGANNFTDIDGGGGSGGGGAGGPTGNGKPGAQSSGVGAIGGNGGGAAAGGGAASGSATSGNAGSTGGVATPGAAGGFAGQPGTSTGVVNGSPSILGAGGGGGAGAGTGSGDTHGAGGDGSMLGWWQQTIDGAIAGPGGGGGGGGIMGDYSTGSEGGDGSLYGGGGGGGYNTSPPGKGAQGIIVISYLPI